MPTIDTARLTLRPFTLADAPAYHAAIHRDPDVMRWLPGGVPQPESESAAKITRFLAHWAEHQCGMWAVIHRADGEFIGQCGLNRIAGTDHIEVGYALAQPYWGGGLATEAAHAALRYGFETVGLDQIVAVALPENAASQRVMVKLGMIYQGVWHVYDADLPAYAITRAAFKPGNAPYTVYPSG